MTHLTKLAFNKTICFVTISNARNIAKMLFSIPHFLDFHGSVYK